MTDSKVKIDKNIPIPKGRDRGKYPWDELEIGDSFLIERPTVNISFENKKRNPKKFMGRTVEGGYRIWRVK